jgi:hypothetical protein
MMIGQRFSIYAARTPGPPEAWASVNVEYNGFALSSGPSGGCHGLRPVSGGAGVGRELGQHCRFASLTGSGTRPNGLPTGVIVGSAVVAKCVRTPGSESRGTYEWHLSDVKRYKRPRRVKRHPQPVWFQPF